MELVKNKASDKYFIVLDDTRGANFLLITPEGEVKRLKRHLFDPQVVVDPKTPQCEHRLTELQMDKYAEHVDQ